MFNLKLMEVPARNAWADVAHAEFQSETKSERHRRMQRGRLWSERSKQTLLRFPQCLAACWTPLRETRQGDNGRRRTSSIAIKLKTLCWDQLTNSRARSKSRIEGAYGLIQREWQRLWKLEGVTTRGDINLWAISKSVTKLSLMHLLLLAQVNNPQVIQLVKVGQRRTQGLKQNNLTEVVSLLFQHLWHRVLPSQKVPWIKQYPTILVHAKAIEVVIRLIVRAWKCLGSPESHPRKQLRKSSRQWSRLNRTWGRGPRSTTKQSNYRMMS